MTLAQRHDTPLGYGQQLCEVLSKSKITVESYGPDKGYGYVWCSVTLTLVQGHYTPLGHGQHLCGVLQ